jgi:hypothetical protein
MHEYVTIMTQSATMGGLWKKIIVIFWKTEYL